MFLSHLCTPFCEHPQDTFQDAALTRERGEAPQWPERGGGSPALALRSPDVICQQEAAAEGEPRPLDPPRRARVNKSPPGVGGPGAQPAPLTCRAAAARLLCRVPAHADPARLQQPATPRRPQPSLQPQSQPQSPAPAQPRWERPRPQDRTQPPPTVRRGRGRAPRPPQRARAAAAGAAPAPAAPGGWSAPSAACTACGHGGAAAGACLSRRSKPATEARTRKRCSHCTADLNSQPRISGHVLAQPPPPPPE